MEYAPNGELFDYIVGKTKYSLLNFFLPTFSFFFFFLNTTLFIFVKEVNLKYFFLLSIFFSYNKG